jgi:hypothetical protein
MRPRVHGARDHRTLVDDDTRTEITFVLGSLLGVTKDVIRMSPDNVTDLQLHEKNPPQ